MRILPPYFVDLPTRSGLMRTHLFQPLDSENKKHPGVVLFSEIYQMTGPIARTAAMIAGRGYCVAVPEVYHEFETPGKVLAYDKPGTDRGNELKIAKRLEDYDDDARAVVDYLATHEGGTGAVGATGMCLGGHLAFRAAMDPRVKATVCCYATDIHGSTLGLGKQDDTLTRISEIKGEIMMIWGRQDPHIPREGRRKIYDALSDANLQFTWHEFIGEHAFLRDEGHRHDPALVMIVNGLIDELYNRCLR